jgi:ribosomal protein S8
MEAAGLNIEATDYYYRALVKSPAFVEARQGLYRAGEQALDNELSVFFQQIQIGEKRKAIYTFLQARALRDKFETVNVNLSINAQYIADFEQVKATYVTEQYELGLKYLDKENYTAAEAVFKEIRKLEPNYKDTKDLQQIAYIEPFYKKGTNALKNKKYRTAYFAFEEVIITDPNYKDSESLRDEALEIGLITLGIIGFENGTSIENANKKAEAFTINALSQINDPFLKVLDRLSYKKLIAEQRLNLSGVVDESTAAETGKLLGVKFVLGGTLLQISGKTGKLIKVKKNGYKEYVKNDNLKYKKTVYYDYQQENRAYVSAQIKIISLTTGEILVSKIISKEVNDKIHYYKYEGDNSSLYPSLDGKLDTSYKNKRKMNDLLSSRKSINSVDILTDKAFRALANIIKSEVENFSYQYVK